MVRIRMQRLGRSRRPFYRISAVDQRSRRDGAVIEQLGWYDPLAKDPAKQIHLDEERVRYWLGQGAQPSPTCRDMLARRKIVSIEPWEKERARRRSLVEARRAAAGGEKAAEQASSSA